MISTLKIDSKLRYRDVGNGPVIVFLHGYLESLKIWNGLKDALSGEFRIIAPDLPGQGHSTISEEVQTMESMAYAIKLLLDNLGVEKCFMVGHSLGGYVTLAFLEKYPDKLTGISLFHSSPFADTLEKKKSRDEEIALIKSGKKEQICNMHIPKTFAKENLDNYQRKIEKFKTIAVETPDNNIIAVLEGMKVRPDRSQLLKNTSVPVQYIIGAQDNFIPLSILDKLELPNNSETVIMEYSGHMGMIEEKEKSVQVLRNFVKKSI